MRICIFILFNLISHLNYAQGLSAFSITQQHGLPSNTVYDIFQDSKGFLWIATENGLARYNGHTFFTYENTAVRSQAMSGILEDAEGRIWLHNFFGEILFIENDSLKKLYSWEPYYRGAFPVIMNLNQTHYISIPDHAFTYSLQDKTWRSLDSLFREEPGDTLVFGGFDKDAEGNVWICYKKGYKTYVTNISENYSIQLLFKGNPVTARIIQWKNRLFVYDRPSQTLFEIKNRSVINVPSIIETNILAQTRKILNLGDSLLAFLGTNGAYLLDRNEQWKHIFPGKNVSSIAADHEGGLWVGTLNEGILYVPFLHTELFSKENLPLLTKLSQTRNFLIAGGYDGSVSVFDKSHYRRHYLQSNSSIEVQSMFADTLANKLLVYSN